MEEKEIVVAETPAAEKPAQHEGRPANKDRRPRGNRPARGDRKGPRRDRPEKEFEDRVVAINRVSRTVKGGRNMRFAALVVIGDGKGRYGFGTGKSKEVPDAIKKATEAAKKNMFRVRLVKGDTIAHEVIGEFGATRVFLRPAPEGTGIVAGGPVRAILELAGVKNIYSKVYGSRTPINIIRATSNGLESIKTFNEVQALRK